MTIGTIDGSHTLVAMTSDRADPSALAGLGLFAGSSPDDLGNLAARLRPVSAAPGEAVVRQGEEGHWFALAVDGTARVVRHDDRGNEHELGVVGPGAIVGELALLRRSPRTATVEAIDPFTAYVGDEDAFAALLEIEPVRDRVVRAARQRLAMNRRAVPVVLRDGTRLTVRPLVPSDRDKLDEAIRNRFSEVSYQRRFFTRGPLNERLVQYLVDVDLRRHFAWIAFAAADPGEPVAGVARYIASSHDPETAELAFSVYDDFQRRGVARMLFGALALAARENGIRRFVAFVLADNVAVRALLSGFGGTWERDEPGVLKTEFGVPDGATLLPDPAAGDDLRAATREITLASHLALG